MGIIKFFSLEEEEEEEEVLAGRECNKRFQLDI